LTFWCVFRINLCEYICCIFNIHILIWFYFLSSYFLYVYEIYQSYCFMFISSIHCPSQTYSPYTVLDFQSCLSLLILKSMFEGVPQCIPAVNVLYILSQLNLSEILVYPFPPTPLFLASFSTYCYILYMYR
jgi:hypothetical protein